MNEQPQNPQVNAPIGGAGPVRVGLLGAFSVTLADGRALTIATKKNRAMLAVMALSPGAQTTRDRLCGLLWGDRGDDQARSSLRQSLAVLRKELGEAEAMVLQTRDDVVGIRLGNVGVDAADFLRLADAADLASLRQAAELYRGEFLADNSIRDLSFDEWLSIERRRLAEKAISVFEKLSALAFMPSMQSETS